ncbi:hypothetical protein BGZ94_006673 [Podila epigama]|nr:hypothetical protein BGZ94_006673 [Podila epigama]
MGACCGKPDRKSQGYVLGGSNTSSNASAQAAGSSNAQRLGTASGKANQNNTSTTTTSAGQTLGAASGSAGNARPQGELSASALAAQKRAEAADWN